MAFPEQIRTLGEIVNPKDNIGPSNSSVKLVLNVLKLEGGGNGSSEAADHSKSWTVF